MPVGVNLGAVCESLRIWGDPGPNQDGLETELECDANLPNGNQSNCVVLFLKTDDDWYFWLLKQGLAHSISTPMVDCNSILALTTWS